MSGLPLRVELDVPAGVDAGERNHVPHRRKGREHDPDGAASSTCMRARRRSSSAPDTEPMPSRATTPARSATRTGYSIFLNDYTPYDRTFRIVDGKGRRVSGKGFHVRKGREAFCLYRTCRRSMSSMSTEKDLAGRYLPVFMLDERGALRHEGGGLYRFQQRTFAATPFPSASSAADWEEGRPA